MAIDLRRLPDPISLKKTRPWWVWGIVLIVFLFIGLITVFILQLDSYLETRHLVIGIIISLISWVAVLCFALYVRGCEEVYAEGWNCTRQQRKEQLIRFAQRPLYVISNQINSASGNIKHAEGIAEGLIFLEAKIPFIGGNPIIHSRFTLDNLEPNQFYEKTAILLSGLHATLSIFNDKPFDTIPTHVRLFIDVPIQAEEITQIWENKLNKTTDFTSWEIIDVDKSSLFLDSWLDDYANHDNLLWCISLHLFEFPKPYRAEAMTSLVCIGGNVIKQKNVREYIQQNKFNLAALHRTEEGDNLDYVLEHAELWGEQEADNLAGLWLSQLSQETSVVVLSKYTEMGLSMEQSHKIETTFGIAGQCDYWVALAIAIEHAIQTEGKQLVVGQNKQRFNASIVSPTILKEDELYD